MRLYKYQGAGNDFLIADNRDRQIHLTPAQVAALCDRRYGIGADGLMLLEPGEGGYDFHMVYYNSDGSSGMMCGNGGRCIVAFAHRQGIRSYRFTASDGPHEAEILGESGNTLTVRLGMRDVDEITWHDDLNTCTSTDSPADVSDLEQPTSEHKVCFLDTGTRHLVCRVDDIERTDVYHIGQKLRYEPRFAPVGVNVNFIQSKGDTLWVRTYEKGVEDETYACGTGITASAIAAWHASECKQRGSEEGCPRHDTTTSVHQKIRALRDDLTVDFIPTADGARDVWLTGPATYVAQIHIDI